MVSISLREPSTFNFNSLPHFLILSQDFSISILLIMSYRNRIFIRVTDLFIFYVKSLV